MNKKSLYIGVASIIGACGLYFGISSNLIAQPIDQQIPVVGTESLTPESQNNTQEPSGIDSELGTIQESDVKEVEPALRVEGDGEWTAPDSNNNANANTEGLNLPKLTAPTIPIISINQLFPPDSFVIGEEKKVSRDIKGTSALFIGINRETGYLLNFRVPVGTSVNFEGLNIKVSGCFHSHPEDPLESWAYVDIVENNLDIRQQIAVIPARDRQRRKQKLENAIVKHGWIMASSPNVTPIDHSIYDVKLLTCEGGIMPQVQNNTVPANGKKPNKPKLAATKAKEEAPVVVEEAVAPPVAPEAEVR